MKKKHKTIIYIIGLIILILSVIFNIFFLNKQHNYKNQSSENILFFGDSITYNYDLEKFFSNKHIVNKGHNSDKTTDLIERIEEDVYEYNPTKVIILIGVNDLIKGIDQDDILLNLQTIITGIKSNRSNAKIYIESVYPINQDILKDSKSEGQKKLRNNDIKILNKSIERICKESDVIYIDVYSILTNKENNLDELYTTDGLHLSSLGYLKVTSILKNYVEK